MRDTLDSTIRNRIDTNIKYLLEKNNKSQSDLARTIDRSIPHMNALVNGKGRYTLELVVLICKYLNVKIDDLMFTDMTQDN